MIDVGMYDEARSHGTISRILALTLASVSDGPR